MRLPCLISRDLQNSIFMEISQKFITFLSESSMIQSPKELTYIDMGRLIDFDFRKVLSRKVETGGKVVFKLPQNKFVDAHTALVSHLKSEPAQCQTPSPHPSSSFASSASSVSLLRVNWDRAEVLLNRNTG